MRACEGMADRLVRPVMFALAVLFSVLTLSRSAAATDLPHVLTGYTNTAWSQKDGLPSGTVYALAQDHDGYLWVGTNDGLYRFDGLRFMSWNSVGEPSLPHRAVRALLSGKDGSIWVGYAEGGLSRIAGGTLQTFEQRDGLLDGSINALVEDSDGVVWAGTPEGLCSFDGHRWRGLSPDDGLPAGAVTAAYATSDGRLIVGGSGGIFQRARGARRFEQLEQAGAEPPRDLAEDAGGQLAITDSIALYRHPGEAVQRPGVLERGRGRSLLFDRRGNLWVGTAGQGLWRVRHQRPGETPVTEHTNALAGLLADGVIAIIEDRDGNIWVGTTEGLNRLTPHRVRQITDLGLVAGVDVTPDGGVWVGTVDALARFPSHDTEEDPERTELRGNPLRAIHVGQDGSVWVATSNFVGRWADHRLLPLSGADGLRHVDAITSGSRGDLWMYDVEQRLVHLVHGQQEQVKLPAAVDNVPIVSLYADRGGRIWLAFAQGQLATISPDGSIRTYGRTNGFEAGICHAMYQDSLGMMWFAGTDGLSRFSDNRFITVHQGNGFPTDNLTAVVEDELSNLWVGTGSGIVRMARGEFDKAVADPSYRVRYTLYDRSDGLAGLPFIYSSNRRAARAGDGRLWFVTGRGLTIIDPRAMQDIPSPGPVRIEAIVADDKRVDMSKSMSKSMSLPAGTSRIEIDYSVPNLTSSLRTRFRYQLDGFDKSWIDAVGRGQVFYTNLPPKTYRFRVMASTANGGTWEEPGDVREFTIRPMFYQASWFYALLITALGFAIWSAWAWQIRQVRHQFALLLSERARISRAIHDTLLQSLTGVALGFDAIAADIESLSPKATERLTRMRKDVEEYIREARQSIWDLRSPKLDRADLVTALRQTCEHIAEDSGVALEFVASGAARPCPPKIEEQVLRVGQEAVTNAVRHAAPTHVKVELSYAGHDVALRVADDGRGFDLSRDNANHYGLISMRERTEDVAGTFRITSQPGRGTEVEAIIPVPEPL
jgi:signal transduction histidine kinase/sugar lactone lactonase YvrE